MAAEGACAGSNGDGMRSCAAHPGGVGDFKRLLVWRKAHALALHAHRVAARMRGPGYAALRNQIIRAALSIPANIVEGHGQASRRDFARFLRYSINSTSELEHHSLTARDLGGMEQRDFLSLMTQLIEVRKMLHGLRASLDRPRRSPNPTSSENPRADARDASPPSPIRTGPEPSD